MDGMNNNFGNLSLGAAEWNPRGVSRNVSTSSNTNSDLNAGQVKEFIPGQGWTVSSANTQVVTNNANEAHIGR